MDERRLEQLEAPTPCLRRNRAPSRPDCSACTCCQGRAAKLDRPTRARVPDSRPRQSLRPHRQAPPHYPDCGRARLRPARSPFRRRRAPAPSRPAPDTGPTASPGCGSHFRRAQWPFRGAAWPPSVCLADRRRGPLPYSTSHEFGVEPKCGFDLRLRVLSDARTSPDARPAADAPRRSWDRAPARGSPRRDRRRHPHARYTHSGDWPAPAPSTPRPAHIRGSISVARAQMRITRRSRPDSPKSPSIQYCRAIR